MECPKGCKRLIYCKDCLKQVCSLTTVFEERRKKVRGSMCKIGGYYMHPDGDYCPDCFSQAWKDGRLN